MYNYYDLSYILVLIGAVISMIASINVKSTYNKYSRVINGRGLVARDVGYGPLAIRSAAVPVCNIGSKLSIPIILIGLFLGITGLAQIGVLLFVFVVLFQLITLPVEFNASARALKILRVNHILEYEELGDASKVLRAAALTYVAALFTSILQLLRLVMIVQGGSNRRRR